MLAMSVSSIDLFWIAELQAAAKQTTRCLFSCRAVWNLFSISCCFSGDMVVLSPGVPVKGK